MRLSVKEDQAFEVGVNWMHFVSKQQEMCELYRPTKMDVVLIVSKV